VAACTGSAGNGSDGGAGARDVFVSTPCPSEAPSQGAACSGAASCPYGKACDQTISVCTGGFWENSPAVLEDGGECPLTPPDHGADCRLCAASGPCTYDSDCDLDAGVSVTAVCNAGTWKVASKDCPHKGVIADGGADVATDGEAGAQDAQDAGDAGGEAGDAHVEGGT